MFFENRTDAGQRLAKVLLGLNRDFSNWEVVGLARGGVIVAAEVAKALNLPLQSFCVDDFETTRPKGTVVVTSLGSGTWYPTRITPRNQITFSMSVSTFRIKGLSRFADEVKQRDDRFNSGNFFPLPERTILCDDGIVSGRSAVTAITALHSRGVRKIILAIPVVLPWVIEGTLKYFVHEIVTWRKATRKDAPTGMFYYSFKEVTDEEVIRAVAANRQMIQVRQNSGS